MVDCIERVVSALIELGRPREMHPEPAPLGQILFRTTDFVDAQARQKHVTIRRRAIDPDPRVTTRHDTTGRATSLSHLPLQKRQDHAKIVRKNCEPPHCCVGWSVKIHHLFSPSRGTAFAPFFDQILTWRES